MKTACARLADDGLRFRISSGSGHVVTTDSAAGDTGARPVELVELPANRQLTNRFEVRA